MGVSGQDEEESSLEESNLYRQLCRNLKNDETWMRDISLGRRIGFYKIKGDLGSGNFSRVRLASHDLTQERVAIKVIDKSKLDSKTTKMLLREITVMDSSYHPHLVRLYEVVETVTKIHLILQLAPGGELFTKLSEQGKYPEARARPIFTQIASALSYLHGNGIIHRDLKAENVFFIGRDEVVVGDFGFATRIETMDQHLTTFCGSPPYAAPELFVDDHYIGPAVDIWALGILLYFLVTGTMPFRGPTVASLKAAILEGSFSCPASLSVECDSLIANILKRKPSNRYSMSQIDSSPWLAGDTWKGADEGYRPYPRFSVDALSANELSVMEELSSLGVKEDLLKQELFKGVRSPAIATYRILLHRSLMSNRGQDTRGRSKDEIRSSSQISRTLTSIPTAHKSKTCILL